MLEDSPTMYFDHWRFPYNVFRSLHNLLSLYFGLPLVLLIYDWLIDLLCLTPLSAIFQLYHGDQFQWWKKPEYLERTTDQLLIYLINNQKGCCTRNSFTAFDIYRFDLLVIVCAIRYFSITGEFSLHIWFKHILLKNYILHFFFHNTI